MYQFNLGPEFKGFKKMLKKDLAEQLGISGAMVSRLAKRGMPTDSLERAQRWRKRHLEPGRMKGVRFDPNQSSPARPSPARAKPAPPAPESPPPGVALQREAELAARYCALALRSTDQGVAAALVEELRRHLRRLPSEAQPVMPVRTWIALVDWVLHDESEVRRFESQDIAVTPDDFALLVTDGLAAGGASWLFEACDWEGHAALGLAGDADDPSALQSVGGAND